MFQGAAAITCLKENIAGYNWGRALRLGWAKTCFKENIVNYLRKLLLGKMYFGKLHIWEVATWKIVAWEVAPGKIEKIHRTVLYFHFKGQPIIQ